MWTSHSTAISPAIHHFTLHHAGKPTSYAQVIEAWRTDSAFRHFYNAILANSPFSAYRWETPPVTSATAARPFEFVLMDAPELARPVDASAFAEHFQEGQEAVSFSNLGGDSLLVIPCPRGPEKSYGHLAAVVRGAPEKQRDALWRMVGEAMARRMSDKPVWLSTAGMGVSWLHIRLDSRPKYYGYRPYMGV